MGKPKDAKTASQRAMSSAVPYSFSACKRPRLAASSRAASFDIIRSKAAIHCDLFSHASSGVCAACIARRYAGVAEVTTGMPIRHNNKSLFSGFPATKESLRSIGTTARSHDVIVSAQVSSLHSWKQTRSKCRARNWRLSDRNNPACCQGRLASVTTCSSNSLCVARVRRIGANVSSCGRFEARPSHTKRNGRPATYCVLTLVATAEWISRMTWILLQNRPMASFCSSVVQTTASARRHIALKL